MNAWTAWACSGEAVRPVPMAQNRLIGDHPAGQRLHPAFRLQQPSCAAITASVVPASRSSRRSPTHSTGTSPAACAARNLRATSALSS